MYADALKPKAPRATLNRVNFQPDSGGSYSPNGQSIIRLPVFSAGQFLDTRRSHMRLTLAFTATTGPIYLRSIYSLFDRLRIISSSGAVLEDIPRYGQMVNKYLDLVLARDQRASLPNLGLSTGSGTQAANTEWAYDVDTWVQAAAAATNTATYDFPLPLSGFFNMTSAGTGQHDGLYMPLPMQQQVYIELTLRNNVNDIFYTNAAATAGTVSDVAITNVSYDAQLVDFGNEIVTRLRDAVMSQGGKVFISSNTYQVSVLASNSAAMNLTVSTRARSVKGIAEIVQLATQAAGTIGVDYDASIWDSTTEWFLLANGSRYPQQALTNDSDVRRHLEYYLGKPLRGVGASRLNFLSDDITPAADGSAVGSAMFAVDLESKSGSDFIEGGYDSSLGASQITINHTQATAQAKFLTVITHIDCIFVVDVMTKDVSVSI
jgi:hypothetical protein